MGTIVSTDERNEWFNVLGVSAWVCEQDTLGESGTMKGVLAYPTQTGRELKPIS